MPFKSLRVRILAVFFVVALAAGTVGYLSSRTATVENPGMMAIVLVLVVVVAAILGIGLAVSITKDLQKLQDGTIRFANGDFSRRVEVSRSDEMGQLATSFNQMAERLRESYQRLAFENRRDETLLESLGEGLISVDEKGHVVLINNSALSMLELEQQDVVGQEVQKVFNIYDERGQLLDVAHRPELTTLLTSKSHSGIFSLHRKEGKPIMIHVGANPIVLDTRIAGAIVVLRDVTKEREVDRMKTEFISLASHQLRTPLSAIKWFSEMLLSADAGKLTPEQLDFVKNISDSSERMIQLVSSLLNISRIESGRIIISPQPTDLRDLVQGIVNDLKAKIEERKHHLVIDIHPDIPNINLDSRMIGQVYLNLLTNAIKYTPKGGEITVVVSKKGRDVVTQVTDNGYGIPKREQKKLFQKFFRAENAVKVETDGTGLGLYLVKSVIESSGGKIWFESDEGKGTTFWFSLPLSGMKAKAGEVTLDS